VGYFPNIVIKVFKWVRILGYFILNCPETRQLRSCFFSTIFLRGFYSYQHKKFEVPCPYKPNRISVTSKNGSNFLLVKLNLFYVGIDFKSTLKLYLLSYSQTVRNTTAGKTALSLFCRLFKITRTFVTTCRNSQLIIRRKSQGMKEWTDMG
jgi:hypothetical protein